MSITKFKFVNFDTNWKVGEIIFDNFNLLVGLSGVGKTRILQVLKTVCSVALNQNSKLSNSEWTITVSTKKGEYIWSARTLEQENIDQSEPLFRFSFEKILCDGKLIVDRKDGKIIFNNNLLPKLKETESCISLLNEESSLKPLYQALELVQTTEAIDKNRPIDYFFSAFEMPKDNTFKDIEELRENHELSLIQKAFFLQELFPEFFKRVEREYKEIFFTVTEIKIDLISKFLDESVKFNYTRLLTDNFLTIAFREQGVDDWVVLHASSSGMQRTLLHLFELVLLPSGTVVIVDEYENSLGVNSLPALTEHLLERSGDIQFILTSHHPYVIQNIPLHCWRIVTRSGSSVKVENADDVKGLKSKSSQDVFMRLINSPAFEEGID